MSIPKELKKSAGGHMNYLLAESCQNTFLLVDCLKESVLTPLFLKLVHAKLLKENRDDALILYAFQPGPEASVLKMAVLGCDGELAEFCGNGSRAVAAYLFAYYPIESPLYLETAQGLHLINSCGKGLYSTKLPQARFEINPRFIKGCFHLPYPARYVEMLEPHLVVEANLSDKELFQLGRQLNAKKEIFPQGINVNACHILSEGYLSVKTYERGVQRLTKSCGTGSLCCSALYGTKQTKVKTPGGLLKVISNKKGMILKGPALLSKML